MSPVVFRFNGIKFHFFANEGKPREPAHIHASRPGATAKLWLRPEVSIAKSKGYNSHEQLMLISQVLQHREQLEQVWDEFFRNSR